jgi:hypothetical protein
MGTHRGTPPWLREHPLTSTVHMQRTKENRQGGWRGPLWPADSQNPLQVEETGNAM